MFWLEVHTNFWSNFRAHYMNWALHSIESNTVSMSTSILCTWEFNVFAKLFLFRNTFFVVKFIYSEKATKFWKSSPYFWLALALHRTKVGWRFRKILLPFQDLWTLPYWLFLSFNVNWGVILTHCKHKNDNKGIKPKLNSWFFCIYLDFFKILKIASKIAFFQRLMWGMNFWERVH